MECARITREKWRREFDSLAFHSRDPPFTVYGAARFEAAREAEVAGVCVHARRPGEAERTARANGRDERSIIDCRGRRSVRAARATKNLDDHPAV